MLVRNPPSQRRHGRDRPFDHRARNVSRVRHSSLSVVLLVVAALIFSTGALFVRALDHPHAFTTVFWRSVSAAVSLAIIVRVRDGGNPVRAVLGLKRPSLVVAACLAVSSIGMVVALSKTSAAIVLVIFSLGPLVAAVFAWLIVGERVGIHTRVAIAVTVAGVAFMVSGPRAQGSAVGVLVAFAIPLAFGLSAVVIRQHADTPMTAAMLLAVVASAVVALPFAHPLAVTRHDLLLLLAFGGLQLGIGLAVFSVGAAMAPATEVALLSMLEPVLGPVWVWLFVNEYPGIRGLIGAAIVFTALALHTLYASTIATGKTPATLPA
jgi:drug/metabolite transporter (DMT)-like permease